MQKTFLLGLGGQQSGANTVYSYLKKHAECATGDVKEMHSLNSYFGASVPVSRQVGKIAELEEALRKEKQRLQSGKNIPKATQKMLGVMDYFGSNYDLQYYLSYFKRLLDATPDAKMVADICPSYSVLTAEQLGEVKALLEGAGYQVKALFLMRDPIDRCYSSLRNVQRNDQQEGQNAGSAAFDNFAESATTTWHKSRTCYETIVPGIESVFAPEDRVIDYYEAFLTSDKIRDFCEVLGISFVPPELNETPASLPLTGGPSAEQIAQVRSVYDTTYQFCAERTGAEALAALWPHYRQPETV